MATGDQGDILARLKAVLPNGWFGSVTPILDGLLSGPANALAAMYALLAYARQQTRLATATDFFLDIAALDFFGLRIRRNVNETDTAFSKRIRKEILRPRVTRASVVQVLTDLGCPAPVIVEPTRPADTGGYNIGGVGYGVAGAYGSLLYPNQAFVTAFRASQSGIPNVGGYSTALGGYGVGSMMYGSLSMVIGPVTDANIFAAIASVTPAGCILWTKISGSPNVIPATGINLAGRTAARTTASGMLANPGVVFLAARAKVAVRNRGVGGGGGGSPSVLSLSGLAHVAVKNRR